MASYTMRGRLMQHRSDRMASYTDGLTANGHVDSFMHYRSAEPKHGRIGMMTSMGYIPPDLSGRRLDIGRHR